MNEINRKNRDIANARAFLDNVKLASEMGTDEDDVVELCTRVYAFLYESAMAFYEEDKHLHPEEYQDE